MGGFGLVSEKYFVNYDLMIAMPQDKLSPIGVLLSELKRGNHFEGSLYLPRVKNFNLITPAMIADDEDWFDTDDSSHPLAIIANDSSYAVIENDIE